jgi:hypothetical protein
MKNLIYVAYFLLKWTDFTAHVIWTGRNSQNTVKNYVFCEDQKFFNHNCSVKAKICTTRGNEIKPDEV